MPCITKGQALAPNGLRREKFPLPEFGKDSYVWLRALSAKEIIDFQDGNVMLPDNGDVTKANPDGGFILIAACAVNDDGNPIYENKDEVKREFAGAASSVIGMVNRIAEMSGTAKKN